MLKYIKKGDNGIGIVDGDGTEIDIRDYVFIYDGDNFDLKHRETGEIIEGGEIMKIDDEGGLQFAIREFHY